MSKQRRRERDRNIWQVSQGTQGTQGAQMAQSTQGTQTVQGTQWAQGTQQTQGSNDQTDDTSWELESNLEPGMLRFLAHVIEDGLQAGLRTQQDFIKHFPPLDIMLGLAERPDLRANILVPTTGVRAKIASKKSAESAGEDLQIALDEGETDAELIVSLFHPDDRVRYLDRARLWSYIIEPKFWMVDRTSKEEFDQAKSHLAYIIDRAIEDRLVTFRDIVDGISVGKMVKYLPLDQLQAVIEKALANGHGNQAFTEQDMLDVVPSNTLVHHIPLATVWESVIVPKIAEQNQLTKSSNANAKVSVNTNTTNGNNTASYNSRPTAPNTSTNAADAGNKVTQTERPGISNGIVTDDSVHAQAA